MWLVAAVCVVGVAALLGFNPFASATWTRWDSFYYLDIARDGYALNACPRAWGPDAVCGDAGWFPAYPIAVAGLHALGSPLAFSAVVLSWALAAGTIVLLWATFFERRTDRTVLAALLFAAFTPGQVYHYAVFPLSLLAFSTVGCLWLLYRERYFLAGAAGAVAVLSYPTGVVLLPVAVGWILAQRSRPLRARVLDACRTGVPMVLALAAFAGMLSLQTGHWDAYFRVQEKYGHALRDPVSATLDSLGPLVAWEGWTPFFVALQTALVTTVLVLVVAHAVIRRTSIPRLDVLVLVWLIAAWALPMSQTMVSLQRPQAALLPMAVLVGRLPRTVLYPLVVAAVVVAFVMESAFLHQVIV